MLPSQQKETEKGDHTEPDKRWQGGRTTSLIEVRQKDSRYVQRGGPKGTLSRRGCGVRIPAGMDIKMALRGRKFLCQQCR